MTIGIDFDGTVVTHEFPRIGKDIGAVPVLKELVDNYHKLILYTMRGTNPDGLLPNHLKEAVDWFRERGVKLYAVNGNPGMGFKTDSPKVYCDLYIDDLALGCPLKVDKELSIYPFVDWVEVRRMLVERRIIDERRYRVP